MWFPGMDDRSIRHKRPRKPCNRCRWSRLCTYRLPLRAAFRGREQFLDGLRFPESEMFVDYSLCPSIVRHTLGTSDQGSSTRSVGMTLARPFKAGKMKQDKPRRVATPATEAVFNRRYATRNAMI